MKSPRGSWSPWFLGDSGLQIRRSVDERRLQKLLVFGFIFEKRVLQQLGSGRPLGRVLLEALADHLAKRFTLTSSIEAVL